MFATAEVEKYNVLKLDATHAMTVNPAESLDNVVLDTTIALQEVNNHHSKLFLDSFLFCFPEPISDRIQYSSEASIIKTEPIPTWALTENTTITQNIPSTTEIFDSDEGSGESSSIENTSVTTVQHTYEPRIEFSTPVTYSVKEVSKKSNYPGKNTSEKGTQTDDGPKITIQEVIPERPEYQITSAPKDMTTKVPIKIIEDTSNELLDTQSYASEKTEVYDNPPPVLRVGEQLLFFKQGQLVSEKDVSTPSPVITIIGAEGLQIGVGSEEIIEHDLLANPEQSTVSPSPKKIEDNPQSYETTTKIVSSEEVTTKETVTVEVNKESKEELTTVHTLETVEDVEAKPKSLKPIKRDQSALWDKSTTEGYKIDLISISPVAETTTTKDSLEDSSSLDSAEYIPEKNPYYPPIPDEITREDNEEKESIKENVSTKAPTTLATVFTTQQNKVLTTQSPLSKQEDKEEIKPEQKAKKGSKNPEIEMQNDEPSSDYSESSSKEDVLDTKKHIKLGSKEEETVKESNEKPVKTGIQLKDPEISSSEETSSDEEKWEQKEQPVPDNPKIIQDVLVGVINNKTQVNKTEWLKKEEDKGVSVKEETKPLIIPLINEKAALPESLLRQPAPSDRNNEKTDVNAEEKEEVETTTVKTDAKIESLEENKKKEDIITKDDVIKITKDAPKSRETLELSEESGSKEFTTNKDHVSIMANDDASVESTKADSSQMDTSELVETVPGFEQTTTKAKTVEEESSEESKEEEMKNNPKTEVENVDLTTEITHKQKDVKIDEKHKRDVVKKVLKDTFDNPKENIRTELVDDAPEKVLENLEHKKELEEEAASHSKESESRESKETTETRDETTEKFDSEIKIEDEFGDNPTKSHKKSTKEKSEEVIQRIGSVAKLRESTENLDTSLIGIFREFISKNQLRYADMKV